jgi:hypothetical protein
MSLRGTTLVAAVAAALVLVTGAGAGSQPPKALDLTSPSAVDSYLRSIDVDPATVVRQVGLRNYAGPRCPGARWNCTTSTRVVQVSLPDGVNKFVCDGQEPQNPGTNPDTNTCVIVQGGSDNKAVCQEEDTAEPAESQRCVIQQQGDRNSAIVDQLIQQRTGPDQDATQTAEVDQTATERNQSQVHQDVKQDAQTGSTQNQNVHQVAIVNQSASGSDNYSDVHQNQDLSEGGAATTQNQNVAGLPSGIEDCDQVHKPGSNPNACANVVQSIAGSAGGTNESHVNQSINELAQTTASPATQTQEQADTGIEAHVDQSNPPGLGTNLKVAYQDARQSAEGGTTQIQTIDPNCCGSATTIGGANNMDDFHQTAIQSASLGELATQVLGITGDTSHFQTPPGLVGVGVQPAATVTDVCQISHDAMNNEASTHFTLTVDPCTGTHVVHTECGITAGGSVSCTPPPQAPPTYSRFFRGL